MALSEMAIWNAKLKDKPYQLPNREARPSCLPKFLPNQLTID